MTIYLLMVIAKLFKALIVPSAIFLNFTIYHRTPATKLMIKAPNTKRSKSTRVRVFVPAEFCPSLESLNSMHAERLQISYWKPIAPKREIKIAVIDTGLNNKVPAFKDHLYLPEKYNKQPNAYGIDLVDGDSSPEDEYGHGTHVAGIILSTNPYVKILPIKYYSKDDSDEVNLNRTIKAIRVAIEAKVDIINYSSGGSGYSKDEEAALRSAKAHGILIVSAGGNETNDIRWNPYYPTSYNLDNLLTVMYHTLDFKLTRSNWGDKIDLSFWGQEVPSYAGSNEYLSCIKFFSGSSQATPFVTGIVSILWQQLPNLNYTQIKQLLISTIKNQDELKAKNHNNGVMDIPQVFKMAEESTHVKFYTTEGIRLHSTGK